MNFQHECPEWDFMEICADDPEFACCSCFEGPEAAQAYERAHALLDKIRNEAD